MALNMNNLTSAQQAIVNQIIATGQQLGTPNIVIQAAINIANAESAFNPLAPNPTTTAYGLFQYVDSTWSSSWSRFVSSNPSNPLSRMSASIARDNPDAQIQVMYADLNRMYAGYDQGIIARNYLPGGNLYSVTQQLQTNGIDINHNFLDYAYLRHNTDPAQIIAVVNTAFTPGNLAATQSLVGTIGQNPIVGSGLAIPGQTSDPGLHYYQINSPTQTGRLYDNGVFYAKDTQTGVEFWSVPTAAGGVIETTQFSGGQVTSVQYIPDPVTGDLKLDTSAPNLQQFILQEKLILSTPPFASGAVDLASRTYASIGAGLDAIAAANALAELVIPYSSTVVAGDTPQATQAALQAAVARQKIVDTWKTALAGENTTGAQLITTSDGIILLRPDGTWIAVSNKEAAINTGTGGVPSINPSGFQTVIQALPTVIDALSFIKAIQTGQPLPVAASGLTLVNALTSTTATDAAGNIVSVTPSSYGLAGAAGVGNGILSILSLDAALKRGDTLGAVVAGAQAVSYGVSAYTSFATANQIAVSSQVTDLSGTLNGTPGTPGVLPYLSLVNSIAQGDSVGVAVAVADMVLIHSAVYSVPYLGWAYAAYDIITSLFGDTPAIPAPWGNGRYVWNGTGVTLAVAGQTGGDQVVSSFMNQMLGSLNTLIAQEQQQNPGSALGLIPNRMPSLSYDTSGFSFTDIDPLQYRAANDAVFEMRKMA